MFPAAGPFGHCGDEIARGTAMAAGGDWARLGAASGGRGTRARRRVAIVAVLVLVGAGPVVVSGAGPAGGIGNTCDETMNPAAQGSSSGLTVACTFTDAGASSSLTINDYDDAVWHYGAARDVNVTVTRTNSSTARQVTIKPRPTNNTAAVTCANSPAGA